MEKIDAIERHRDPRRIADGWVKTGSGHWVPRPGVGGDVPSLARASRSPGDPAGLSPDEDDD